MCTVSFALLATARKNSSASSVSKPAIEVAGSVRLERAVGPAADVDRAGAERLVHRHGRVAVAGDAAAVAERLVERLPEHDADVLGRVVRAGLEVARSRSPSRSSRAWRASRSSMWSRKPDAGRDVGVAGAVERQLERGSASPWSSARPRRRAVVWWSPSSCLMPRWAGSARASADSACTGKPSARATLPTCGASARAAAVGQRYQRLSAQKRRRAERPGEARGAAGRQHVVGAGDVVAERRAAVAAEEHAAGSRAPARASASASAHGQLEVLRRDRVRRARRPPRGRGRAPAPAARRTTLGALASSALGLRLDRVEQLVARADAAPAGCPAPCSACAARSSATSARVGVLVGDHDQLARALRCRRCRPARRPGAWPPARRRCPGPTITSTGGDRLGPVRERGDRLRAAHRVDLVHAAQRAGGEDHGWPRRPGRAASRPRSRSTPATRAGTQHITTVEG